MDKNDITRKLTVREFMKRFPDENACLDRLMSVRFSQSALAEQLGVNKSAPSRWFAGEPPNWEANTVADIANALGVDIEVYARDRKSGALFASHGVVTTGQAPMIISNGRDGLQTLPPPGPTTNDDFPSLRVFAVGN